MASAVVPSSNQVKKAGSTLRKFERADGQGKMEMLDRARSAIETIEAWRRAHYKPLVTANNGLRSMCRTAGVPVEVTQRLKRRQTILDKIKREPTLDVSRMQDIGGCRAVVDDLDQLSRLRARIESNGRVVATSDYIATPRASGYRAVHLVVTYQERKVEVQLRTEWMHSWALATEYYSAVLGENIKQDGTHPVQLFLRSASDIIDQQARRIKVLPELFEAHEQNRLAALPYISGDATS